MIISKKINHRNENRKENPKLRNYVIEKIKQDDLRKIIADRLKNVDINIKYAGKGAIYKYIYSVYGKQLEPYLYHNTVSKKLEPKKKKGEKLTDDIF